ncbi:MAG: CDP-diacylglycerol--glycerol-3-phosphate 3-phosphatidyltransferase [Nitrospirae bacterium]|nr:CDP-diacylglycerol--glycerol-3-phosphate 3-phosphatidyltransferase [Nitrospirota bacterium]
MIKNIPNILTVTRILLLPPFVAAFMYNKYQAALYIFILAACTDIFDGLVARITKQTTELGRILDPIADKFFMVTSFVLMTYYGMIPKWITIVVISRDLIVITGCIITYFIVNRLKIEPTILGKTSSAFQFVLIGVVLLLINMNGDTSSLFLLLIFIAFLTIVSGLQYIYNGLKTINPGNGQA